MLLEKRISIVTGAASGIGWAIAERFMEEGASVVAFDLDGDGLQRLQDLTKELAGSVECIVGDAAEPEKVEGCVDLAVELYGQLDIVVANAAIPAGRDVEQTSPEHWDKVISVDLKGPYLLAKYAIPHMKRQGRGSIINIASVNGFWAERRLAAYAAAKGGLMALTKSIAIDFGRQGIRCNCICPGMIDTPGARRYFSTLEDGEHAAKKSAQRHALGRLGAPSEIAAMAVFLASDEASFCTGQSFIVDGGLTAGMADKE